MKTLFRILSVLLMFSVLPVSAQEAKKNGKVTVKYANGKPKESGKMKDYQREGEWKAWREDGSLRKVSHYKAGQLHGLYTEYHANGKKAEEVNYVMGQQDGTGYGWHPNGTLAAEVHFVNGKREGIQKFWYDNGKQRRQESYKNGELEYRWSWWQDGRLKETASYKDGKKDGTWREYPETPTDTFPKRIKTYSMGELHGPKIEYANGRMKDEQHYVNGKKEGLCRRWNNDGTLSREENYKAGKKDGVSNRYENGKLMSEGNYVNGKRQGVQKEYDPAGRLGLAEWYTLGDKDSAYTYFPNGKVFRREVYSPTTGTLSRESQCMEWDSLGNLTGKGSCGRRGDWITYYPGGKTESITPWKYGQLNGTYRKWYPNGKTMVEVVYEYGRVRGQAKVWDEKGKPLKAGSPEYETILSANNPWGTDYDLDQEGYDNVEGEYEMIVPTTVDRVVEVSQVEEVFTFAEQMPRFPGPDTAMSSYITTNIMYPVVEKEAGKQGTVYITFVVEKDGSITNVKAAKEVAGAPGFTKEAMRVVKSMPKWEPGKMNGRPVRVQMTIPVKFIIR